MAEQQNTVPTDKPESLADELSGLTEPQGQDVKDEENKPTVEPNVENQNEQGQEKEKESSGHDAQANLQNNEQLSKNEQASEPYQTQPTESQAQQVKQEEVTSKKEDQVKVQPTASIQPTEKSKQQPKQQAIPEEAKSDVKVKEQPQPPQEEPKEEIVAKVKLEEPVKKIPQQVIPSVEQIPKKSEAGQKLTEKEGEKGKQEAQPRKRRKRVFKDKQKQQLPSSSSADPTSPQQTVAQAPGSQPASQPVAAAQRVHAILQQVPHITHEDDMRILSDTSFSKKKQNYIQLRQWSRLRSEHMALHLNVVDELQSELQKILKASMDNLELYSSFYRERANQQDKYASHPIINTHFATMSNDLSKDIYINCSRLLNSLADQNLQRSKKSQTLALFIRKNILIDNIQDHIKRTHIETLKVRERISTTRNGLLRCRDDIDRKIVKMAGRYNNYVTQFNHNPNKDFLKTQLGYLRLTYEQSQIQRKLGEYVYDYLKMAADEEVKRAEVIKKSIRLYADAMKVAYDIKPDADGLLQLDKEQELKLIPEFYAVQELIDPKFVDLLKKTLKMDGQLNMHALRDYLFSLKPFNFNSRLLVLKQYPIIRDLTKDKQEPGKLLITVDSFLHLFFDSESSAPFSKPSISIKADKYLSIKTNKDLVVQLGRKEEKKNVLSYFVWSKKSEASVAVRFLKRDALEEFEQFVIKLI